MPSELNSLPALRFLLPWCLLLLAGCPGGTANTPATQKSSGKTIRIYSSLPRTGSAKAQTDTIVNGIRLALEEIDSKVGEFEIQYVDLDDATASAGQWTIDAETANAERAASDTDCMVYIGTYNSGAAKVSIPILNRANLLMVSPANTHPGFTKPGFGEANEPFVYFEKTGKRNYCRVVPTDDLQGGLAAEWTKEMGITKVFAIDDSEVYGKGLADLFVRRCEEIGVEVLGRETIDPKGSEFRAMMTNIKKLGPQLIYFGGTSQTKGGQIAKDMVSVGLDAKLMAPDGCFENAFILSAGPENVNDRCYVTFGGLPPSELRGNGKKFVDRYREKYKGEPESYAVYGYECAKVAIDAIRRAGKKDRAAIVEAAFKTKDFDGALGVWSFDENGDTTSKMISGNIVRNGKFEFVKKLGS